jgi:hypothetical protein
VADVGRWPTRTYPGTKRNNSTVTPYRHLKPIGAFGVGIGLLRGARIEVRLADDTDVVSDHPSSPLRPPLTPCPMRLSTNSLRR